VAAALGPNVVAFGKFDGVHLGHRALLDRAAGAARRLSLPYGVVTFERHPYAYLGRGPVPPALTGLGERLRLFGTGGVHFVVLLPADASVLDMPAEAFGEEVLHKRMDVRVVVVGRNFRFGHRGAGGVLTLRELSSATGMDGVEVGMVEVAQGPVSATRIRSCLARGEVELASALLGRPFEVVGTPRILDPTAASVTVPVTRAVPAPGRYFGSFRQSDGAAAAASIDVAAPADGRHRITVYWAEAGFRRDGPNRRTYLAFEKAT
jgi:riboflavin kinase / FMN adenylyltransferase